MSGGRRPINLGACPQRGAEAIAATFNFDHVFALGVRMISSGLSQFESGPIRVIFKIPPKNLCAAH